MHVAVVIRNVVDCRVLLPPGSYLEKPLPEGQIKIINPSDWSALEQAMALKREGSVKKITVLNLGSGEGEEALRWCLAAGADAAQRLWDPALKEADQLGKGKTLAAAIQRLEVDLTLCGDSCLDQLDSLMPGIAAGVAGMVYVTETELVEKLTAGQAIVIRRREKGKRERVAIRIPALLAMTGTGGTTAERSDLAGSISALTREIPCWDLQNLGLAAETVGGRGAKIAYSQICPAKPPLIRPRTPNDRLPSEQRLREIISGGAVRKQGEVLTGEPENLVARICEFLCRDPVMRL